MTYIKIIDCHDPELWYSGLVGKVTKAYTIENGDALIDNKQVEILTGISSESSFKGCVLEGDFVTGDMYYEETFIELP